MIEQLRLGRTPFALTTDFVLDETVTILGKRKGFGAQNAADVAVNLLSSPRVFVVYVDEGLLRNALKLYPIHRGRLSLTDVVSVVVMERYAVKDIFSHDADFDGLKGIRRKATA